MNFGQISRLLAGFLLFFSLFLLVPFVVSFFEVHQNDNLDRLDTELAFGIALGTGLLVSGLLWFAGAGAKRELYRRDGLATVVFAWLFAASIAAVPFKWSGAIPDPIDAFFEAMSGITTTGATVLGTDNHDIEWMPTSILLWRAMLQWIGGIGIVLVFIVLLPAMGVTGSRLLTSEQVGMSDESHRPRMSAQARRIFLLYVSLTLLAGISYKLAGMGGFDALCHGFTTLASGGFSNDNQSIGGHDNLAVELVAIGFMFLAGCNFLMLLRAFARRPSSKNTSLIHSIEFKVYAGLLLGITLAMTFSLWAWGGQFYDSAVGITHDYSGFGRCLRDAAFQTTSILTSTGYCSTNFNCFPAVALFLLLLCMFVGGCTGSTSGGFKVLRFLACGKLLGYAVRHFVRPRSVEAIKVSNSPLSAEAVTAILTLLLLWIVFVIAGTFVFAASDGFTLGSAFMTSICMMSCIGPSISEVAVQADGSLHLLEALQLSQGEQRMAPVVDVGPYGGYGALHSGTKLFMCLQMLLGRLEILAPLALLTPGFWRR